MMLLANVVVVALTMGATGKAAAPKLVGQLKVPAQVVLALPSDGGVADAGVAQKPGATMTAEVKELVDRMQQFYEVTTDFAADFRQDYTYKTFKRTQTSTGTVRYLKPAMMRWEYAPASAKGSTRDAGASSADAGVTMVKTFVLAGDRVYAYDPEAKLLTRASIATATLSASVTFLWGQGKLADEFSIAKVACRTKSCTGVLLELTPLKPDPRFRKVYLEVDSASAQVLVSTVIDPDGSENAITFINLKPNVGLNKEMFKLAPPPDTQVQDFLQGAGAPSGAPVPSAAPKKEAPSGGGALKLP